MSEMKRDAAQFIGYEYKEIDVHGEYGSLCLDCYPSFGWEPDERTAEGARGKLTLRRSRKLVNKMELTHLQRHFEACLDEIRALEKSKTADATVWTIIVGLIGTVFLTGATFAAVHQPPLYVLTAILAVPGFIGWALPYFIYRKLAAKRMKVVTELVEQKYDEIYEICQQGNKLLS